MAILKLNIFVLCPTLLCPSSTLLKYLEGASKEDFISFWINFRKSSCHILCSSGKRYINKRIILGQGNNSEKNKMIKILIQSNKCLLCIINNTRAK